MAQEGTTEDKSMEQEEEVTEESFLKDLYSFMKQRDTAIERIPHLGFKQIDLYVMFKTVKDLGGYHQVTAQQQWKRVYNILGGNPRSTSAATCTRRHYEKLLLPYECRLSGYTEDLAIVPPRPHKRFRYSTYHDNDDDLPPSIKRHNYRHMPSFNPLSHDFQDRQIRFVPMPVRYFPPGCQSLPAYFPTPPTIQTNPESPTHARAHNPPPCSMTPPLVRDSLSEPLEQLRNLAVVYKSSSGWVEPLNLSKKGGQLETTSHTPSSFARPVSNKTPKFLNRASPLYRTGPVTKDEGVDAPTAGLVTPPGLVPSQVAESPFVTNSPHVIDLTSTSCSSPEVKVEPRSPAPWSGGGRGSPAAFPSRPSERRFHPAWPGGSPAGSLPTAPVRPLGVGSASARGPPLGPPGRMEVQIPLALLQDWIQGGLISSSQISCSGPVGQKPSGDSAPREVRTHSRCSSAGSDDSVCMSPTDLSVRKHPQGDQRAQPWERNTPGLANPVVRHERQPVPSSPYAGMTSLSARELKHPASRGGFCPWGAPLKRPPSPDHQERSDTTQGGPHATAPRPPGHDSASPLHRPGGRGSRSTGAPPAAVPVNPASAPMIQLTQDEYLRLKRLISSSP